ncbi:WhiB family transcriptional regulator [Streptomyces sp. NBC_01764]|uniref:WhiB family transcriptional regulator n=1 Tax=Streptomyces sp. NBC_01764 TaxID=2975935 RepID=UPI0022530BC1|nr:WhiB family transcriptional regulator [Streptomyces sp. NBC_01764]MCX4411539.1 WhiB family transcriptional regulator [Streptomyces sp. NBC_01764]
MNRSVIVTTLQATRAAQAPASDLPVNSNWRVRGACAKEDPELFFPVGNNGPALLQIEEAKSVCRRCPVLVTCAAWTLETGQTHGVSGGMSEDERRRMKRRAARKRAAA